MDRKTWAPGVGRSALAAAAVFLAFGAHADLAVPAWYSEAGAGDWHYRAPIAIPPAAADGSTVVVDVDLTSLLGQLGIDASAVDPDEQSVRVVRPNGALAIVQEFTDVVFAGVLDGTNDGRGEVRFLLEDSAAAGSYHLYFDILENGPKPASPAQPVNGNFEASAGSVPTGWTTSAVNANGGQNNEVYRTSPAATMNLAAGCSTNGPTGSTRARMVRGPALQVRRGTSSVTATIARMAAAASRYGCRETSMCRAAERLET